MAARNLCQWTHQWRLKTNLADASLRATGGLFVARLVSLSKNFAFSLPGAI